jgi:hypothetical protein
MVSVIRLLLGAVVVTVLSGCSSRAVVGVFDAKPRALGLAMT